MCYNSIPMSLSFSDIQTALDLIDFDSLAAQQIMMPDVRPRQRPSDKPGQVRVGAVLLLLYPNQDDTQGGLNLLLTRRRDDLARHAGQISFPGGRREGTEALAATALRETYEEVGVDPAEVTLLGKLAPLYIFPSDFEVHPFVGRYENGRPSFTPQANEVAEIIETPLNHLLDPNARREEDWLLPGLPNPLPIPFYNVQGYKVWGATAIILSEFLERLRRII